MSKRLFIKYVLSKKLSKMSDIPPTAFTVKVQYDNYLTMYHVSVSGLFIPEIKTSTESRDKVITLLTSANEYHSVHYDGREGRVKLPFWIHFCNRYDVDAKLEDNYHKWFSSVDQFTAALPDLPHHPFVYPENDDSD